jgi:uncharacterized protein YcbX
MGGMHVSGLHVFPVKSLRGGRAAAAAVEPCGLAGDRRWMVVDPAGRFMTQREHPLMTRVQAVVEADSLVLSTDGGMRLTVPNNRHGALLPVRVWKDTVPARDCGSEAAARLSEALCTPCRLVYLVSQTARKIRDDFAAHDGEMVSFADGFPVLLATMASLAALNDRLTQPVPMLRFRPNLVVSGTPPWAEDRWRRIRIGEAIFRVAKPCDRCIMTTLDPETGLQPDGNEPLRTLSLFRRSVTGSVMFGQNLVPECCGVLRVGDALEVLEAGESNVVFR